MSPQARVMVGLSGGVDSSVSALLLKEQDYAVEGVFMMNWQEDNDPHCQASRDLSDARAVCDKLKIPLHTVNFAQMYWDKVFQNFLDEYAAGRTPNPDILCNQEIKFKAFLDYALAEKADYIATGHYARINYANGHAQLLKGTDPNKDQSYFLYAIDPSALERSLFPVGHLLKPEVRQLAKAAGFANHTKKDSTGICFIGERKFKNFLNEYLLAQPGDIETPEGKIIARHQGLMFYTIGQRQGLGIGGKKEYGETPWYVLDKDIKRNVLIVGQGQNHPLLFAPALICAQLRWLEPMPLAGELACQAKIRYRQPDQPCILKPLTDGCYYVRFEKPQRAITPGQSIVFYQGERCLGGAVITNATSAEN